MNHHDTAWLRNDLQNAKERLAEQVLAEGYSAVVEITPSITQVTQVPSAVS